MLWEELGFFRESINGSDSCCISLSTNKAQNCSERVHKELDRASVVRKSSRLLESLTLSEQKIGDGKQTRRRIKK